MRPAPPPDGGAAAAAGAPAQGRGRGRGGSGFSQSEVTPLVVNGVMYVATPYNRVVALDPTTGKESWAFQLPSGNPSTRGVEYSQATRRRRRKSSSAPATAGSISLDAKTGVPNPTFGDERQSST